MTNRKLSTLTKDQTPGKRTTSIRPKTLDRVQAVLPHLVKKENTTDFISNAADRRVRDEMKRNPDIILPAHCAFTNS